MKALVRIVCISTILVTHVARADPGDNEQTPSLFDQVREGVKKLKPGMRWRQCDALLLVEKLRDAGTVFDGAMATTIYRGFPKRSQVLEVTEQSLIDNSVIVKAILRDGDKIVAQFDDNK